MTTTDIRQLLHRFIETAEEKKIKAIYTIFEDELVQDNWEYTDAFKAELDHRFDYYKNGGEMITGAEANKQIEELVNKGNAK